MSLSVENRKDILSSSVFCHLIGKFQTSKDDLSNISRSANIEADKLLEKSAGLFAFKESDFTLNVKNAEIDHLAKKFANSRSIYANCHAFIKFFPDIEVQNK